MTDYAEEFVVYGTRYGIEDYEAPGKHFMPHRRTHRFKMWAGGCGIGNSDDLDDARRKLHEYIVSTVNAAYHGHQEQMVAAQRELAKLGKDPFNLGLFRGPMTVSPETAEPAS